MVEKLVIPRVPGAWIILSVAAVALAGMIPLLVHLRLYSKNKYYCPNCPDTQWFVPLNADLSTESEENDCGIFLILILRVH